MQTLTEKVKMALLPSGFMNPEILQKAEHPFLASISLIPLRLLLSKSAFVVLPPDYLLYKENELS